jgi:hypothetical protein
MTDSPLRGITEWGSHLVHGMHIGAGAGVFACDCPPEIIREHARLVRLGVGKRRLLGFLDRIARPLYWWLGR